MSVAHKIAGKRNPRHVIEKLLARKRGMKDEVLQYIKATRLYLRI